MRTGYHFMRWMKLTGLAIACGIAAGTASALFLALLQGASEMQSNHAFLLWLLPAGGAFMSGLYVKYGKESIRGNNLIFEQVHSGGGEVPLRMAPLVLVGTLITHLFGGSAGREGTAVQLGGSLSSALGRLFRLEKEERSLIVLCGICAGFGSVFGTPLAAVLFGVEVAAKGTERWRALLPCLVASYTGHYVTLAWGIAHDHYSIGEAQPLQWLTLAKVAAAAIAFGAAAALFVWLTSVLRRGFVRYFKHPALRSLVGGCLVIALVLAIGSRDYLGLGLPLMERAFDGEAVSPLVPLLKLLFTTVTLGAGFLGGEVTPLFVIGSTLGGALSGLLSLPAPFLAALGLAAVFGAAAKTPLACTLLGIELFGAASAPYFLAACAISVIVSGRSGIYASHVRYYQAPKR